MRTVVLSIAEREELLLSGNFGRAMLASFIDVNPATMTAHLGISLEGPDMGILYRRRRFFPHRGRRLRLLGLKRGHYQAPDPIITDDHIHQLEDLIHVAISRNYLDIAKHLVSPEILLHQIQQVLGSFAWAGTENWHMFRSALLAAKESLRPIAQLLANNPELDWWWSAVHQDSQHWISQRNDHGLSNQELSDAFTMNSSRHIFFPPVDK